MYRVLMIGERGAIGQQIFDYVSELDAEVIWTRTPEQALDACQKSRFDFYLLSGRVLEKEGLSFCGELPDIEKVPTIALIEGWSQDRMELCRSQGVDLMLSEPVPMLRLHNCMSALVKKYYGPTGNQFLKCDQIVLYLDTKQVLVHQQPVKLPQKVFRVLHYLLEHKNQVVSREDLLNQIWGIDFWGEDRVVDNHIKKLRKLLGEQGKHIQTVFKVGYMIKDI